MQQNAVTSEREALRYLRDALPEADQIALSDEALLRVARHALSVRAEVSWGSRIPEDVFCAFVLFPRVNNEDPVFYHAPIWAQLRPRVRTLSMEAAALEINLWCCEQASYRSTDVRTANALTVMRRGFGRCGEESVLLVCALRAAGIPARQVYAPRWAHCDDNHAWVEVWVDGSWRYMGACEPEPALDSGWFTAAASRAMRVHTRAYGLRPEGEQIDGRAGGAYILNRTAAYASARLLTVRVTRRGQPLSGICVRFELANMAEFFSIHAQKTDMHGEVSLLTGLGTLHLHLHDGRRYLCHTVDVAQTDICELDFERAVEFEREARPFAQRAPEETRIQPDAASAGAADAHARRLAGCEAARKVRLQSAPAVNPDIPRFLSEDSDAQERRALLDSLREKDRDDITLAALEDALRGALPFQSRYPRAIWIESVLCPRVRDEMLYPVRAFLRENLGPFSCAAEVWAALEARITVCDMQPPAFTPDLRAVMRAGRCNRDALDVLFVAAARAHGFAARLNPVSGVKEFFDGRAYRALLPEQSANARLLLKNNSAQLLQYGVHFTLGVLSEGVFRSLEMSGARLEDALEIFLSAGRYRAVCCTRQIDGAIDGTTVPFELLAGETTEVHLMPCNDRTAEKLLCAALPPLTAQSQAGPVLLPDALRGRSALVALIAPGQEPTEHFLRELIEAHPLPEAQGIAVYLLAEREEALNDSSLREVLSALPDAALLTAPDRAVLREWRRLLRAGDLRLPLAVALNRRGEGLFAFANYSVGSVRSLLRVLATAE